MHWISVSFYEMDDNKDDTHDHVLPFLFDIAKLFGISFTFQVRFYKGMWGGVLFSFLGPGMIFSILSFYIHLNKFHDLLT